MRGAPTSDEHSGAGRPTRRQLRSRLQRREGLDQVPLACAPDFHLVVSDVDVLPTVPPCGGNEEPSQLVGIVRVRFKVKVRVSSPRHNTRNSNSVVPAFSGAAGSLAELDGSAPDPAGAATLPRFPCPDPTISSHDLRRFNARCAVLGATSYFALISF